MGRDNEDIIRIWDPKLQDARDAFSKILIYKEELSDPDNNIWVYVDPARPNEEIISNVYNSDVRLDPDFFKLTPKP